MYMYQTLSNISIVPFNFKIPKTQKTQLPPSWRNVLHSGQGVGGLKKAAVSYRAQQRDSGAVAPTGLCHGVPEIWVPQ
jgi:hypothetical protein